MSDYTPTTEVVRDSFCESYADHLSGFKREEFDRWFAEEIRKAQEGAWYLGAITATNYALNGSPSLPENPYEKESQ